MKKYFYLGSIVILLLAFATVYGKFRKQQSITSFVGTWVFSTNSSEFVLNLSESGTVLMGTHCSVMLNGNRIDCSEDDEYSFSGTITDPNLVIGTFKSFSSYTTGKAIIQKLSDTTITWKITEKPTGEFYIPQNVVLTKN